MSRVKELLRSIWDLLYCWYISNPILNPSVLKIQPITKKSRLGNKSTKFRVMKRNHFFDSWRLIGDFKTFKRAMNAAMEGK